MSLHFKTAELIMPYEISTDETSGLTRITIIGDVAFVELVEILDLLAPEGKYLTNKRLWDVTQGGAAVTSAELERFAYEGKARDTGEPTKVAIVASEDVQYGLSRLHEVYRTAESVVQQVSFREIDEALEWLES